MHHLQVPIQLFLMGNLTLQYVHQTYQTLNLLILQQHRVLIQVTR